MNANKRYVSEKKQTGLISSVASLPDKVFGMVGNV